MPLEENNTWEIVDKSKDQGIRKLKFVLKWETGCDSSIQKSYNGLVAREFTRIQGADFDDSYAPVRNITKFEVEVKRFCYMPVH